MADVSIFGRFSIGIRLAVAACGLLIPGVASAYIGPSFLQLPNIDGGWAGQPYENWVRANSNYWRSGRGPGGPGGVAVNAGAPAPPPGGSFVIAVDKHSPALHGMMDLCLNKTAVVQAGYAELADLAGGPQGSDRSAQTPKYLEYRLSDVRISDCPVVANAPEQAFVISFNAMQRLNAVPQPPAPPPVLKPVALRPEPNGSRTKSFVVTWFAQANDVSDDQCPVMATKPSPELYFTYLSKADADKERARLVASGGPGVPQLGQRGPNGLDVTRLPGIVPDPGQPLPRMKGVRGLNLDGRPGIDNQYFAAVGCVPGVQGHRGFAPQFTNGQMRDGEFSILIQLTGVDNMRNDDSIDVTWFYSLDAMAKNGAGNAILPDYTFRITDKPLYRPFVIRLHGRIVNGVVITDPVAQFSVYMGQFGFPTVKQFFDARMRLEFQPDGGLKGVLGAYQDLWKEASRFTSPLGENQWNYEAPATYNALKRAADGMKDPATGEYGGISIAYDIEASPAFIAAANAPTLAANQRR